MRPDDSAPPCPRTGRGPRLLVLSIVALLTSASLALANDDAHRLAERFAGASRDEAAKSSATSPGPTPSASTARDPAAEAQSRAKAIEAARAAQKARQLAEARRREAERRAAEMRVDEARMLEQVRAELEQLHAEERAAQAAERAAADTLTAMGPHPSDATVTAPVAASEAAPSAPKVVEPAAAAPSPAAPAVVAVPSSPAASPARSGPDVAVLEAEREQEGRRLEEKLAKARQSRLGGADSPATGAAPADDKEARDTTSVAPAAAVAAQPETSAVAAAAEGAAVSSVMFSDTVTILLAIEPGSTGIRRHNSTADPVICIGPDCYVSEGAGLTARKVTRGQIAGPVLTLGRRAGACNQRTACVFRNVPLPEAMAMLQPIDLRLLRHDRREEVRVAADPSCALAAGSVVCQKLVRGPDWIAWIVPETIAAQAGADRLETALAQKLGGQRTAVLRPLR